MDRWSVTVGAAGVGRISDLAPPITPETARRFGDAEVQSRRMLHRRCRGSELKDAASALMACPKSPRTKSLAGDSFSERPTIYSHDSPNSFHEPERPRALEKAVNRAENTPTGEGQDEPMAPVLERVRNQHCRHGEKAERC